MKIYVFGLGAIGSNLIVQLMKQYPDFEYFGIDYDKIEEKNIKTQAYFLEQVGMPKAYAIPIIASRFLRKFKYNPQNIKIEKPICIDYNISDKDSLFIDCFDNAKSRKLLLGTQIGHGNVLHIGFSPFYSAEIMWQKDYDVPNDVDKRQNDICSMPDAVSFIHFIVNYSVLNISNYINNGIQNSYIITNKTNIIKL